MPKLGIITGLQFEADIARKSRLGKDQAIILCHGPGPDRAERAARAAIEAGAQRLISFGIAGALSPDLMPGDIVTAAVVTDGDTTYQPDTVFDSSLSECMKSHSQHIQTKILSIDTLVATPADKERLHRASQAKVVDMESAGMARAAIAHDTAFAVLRVISDHAGQRLPDAAVKGSRADGSVAVLPVLEELLKHPASLPDLIRVARQTGRARRVLGDLARHVLPRLV